MVGCDGDGHHAVVGEVEEGEESDEIEPEEFRECPFEAHHGVHDQGVVGCLDEHIWYFYDHLNESP